MKPSNIEQGKVRILLKTMLAMLTYFILLTLLLQPFVAGF